MKRGKYKGEAEIGRGIKLLKKKLVPVEFYWVLYPIRSFVVGLNPLVGNVESTTAGITRIMIISKIEMGVVIFILMCRSLESASRTDLSSSRAHT